MATPLLSSSNTAFTTVRFIRYRERGVNAPARVGALLPLDGNTVFDVVHDDGGSAAAGSSASLRLQSLSRVLEAYHADPKSVTFAASTFGLGDVDVLAPFDDATAASGVHNKIVCVGKNYFEHVGEVDSSMPGISRDAVPELPIIFPKAGTSVVAYGQDIRTHGRLDVDYEGELACVIGATCFGAGTRALESMSEEEILEKYVVGWTVANDVTARTLQKQHQQWYLGKSCDTHCPCGPWIVAGSALPLGGAAELVTYVNGEERQRAKISDMIFSVATLISTISQYQTLYAGDLILTGTPKGVGAGQKPSALFLKSGDVVDIDIEGVGRLSNGVAS